MHLFIYLIFMLHIEQIVISTTDNSEYEEKQDKVT